MSLFEFILVMVSFVLAIGVTHLLQGSVKIFRHRATLGLDWVPLAFLVGAIASRRTAKFVAAAYLVLSAVGGFATRFQPGSFGPS